MTLNLLGITLLYLLTTRIELLILLDLISLLLQTTGIIYFFTLGIMCTSHFTTLIGVDNFFRYIIKCFHSTSINS